MQMQGYELSKESILQKHIIMKKTEITEKVQEIFRDVLDNEDIVLNSSTTADASKNADFTKFMYN